MPSTNTLVKDQDQGEEHCKLHAGDQDPAPPAPLDAQGYSPMGAADRHTEWW